MSVGGHIMDGQMWLGEKGSCCVKLDGDEQVDENCMPRGE